MRALLLVAAGSILVAGCEMWDARGVETDRWMVRSYRAAQVDNGIIAEHTIYPHYFCSNSSRLTPAGERVVCVLSEYYCQNPGEVNVPRGDVGEDLYKARVAAVIDMMGREGVETSRLSLVDGHTPGDGMSSERVVRIMSQTEQDYFKYGSKGAVTTTSPAF
jgi:hypothetical protein